MGVAAIMAATHCGLKLCILGGFSVRFRKEVRTDQEAGKKTGDK